MGATNTPNPLFPAPELLALPAPFPPVLEAPPPNHHHH